MSTNLDKLDGFPRLGSREAYIDVLRGLAILGVVGLHCLQAVPPDSQSLRLVMLAGVRGVQLFYVVSALTLCSSWHRRHDSDPLQAANFYLRRLFRIAPLFTVAILFYLSLYGARPLYWRPNGLRQWFIPVTFAMQHGWHPETINGIVPGGWSVAVEVTFYAILPMILRYVHGAIGALGFVVIATVICLVNERFMPCIWSPFYDRDQQYLVDAFIFFNFFSQLPVFALGIVTFHSVRVSSALPILFAAVFCCAYSVLTRGEGSAHGLFGGLFAHHLSQTCVLCLFVFLLSFWKCTGVVFTPVRLLGKVSYGVYLFHIPVIDAFEHGFGWAGAHGDGPCIGFLALTLGTGFVIAEALRRGVEDPFIRFGRILITARSVRAMPP